MNGSRTTVVGRLDETITIRLTKVEHEMLKELQKRDKRYKKGPEIKIKGEIKDNS